MAKIYTGISKNLEIRFYMMDSTDLVEKARVLHETTPVSTVAFGRTLTGASIMGRMLKNENDKLTLQIMGEGDIKRILTVSDYKGNVKGYISNPHVDRPIREDGKIDVGGAIGTDGFLSVVKDYGLKEPFIGKTKLLTGEVAQDLAAYFMYSEQQPSLVSLGVALDKDFSVKTAGGIIIQPLPFPEEETLEKLEKIGRNMPSISELFGMGKTPEEIATEVLEGFEIEMTDEGDVEFICDCNREKFRKGLITLGKEELTSILEEDGKAEICCHFCNTKYQFDKEELENILGDM